MNPSPAEVQPLLLPRLLDPLSTRIHRTFTLGFLSQLFLGLSIYIDVSIIPDNLKEAVSHNALFHYLSSASP